MAVTDEPDDAGDEIAKDALSEPAAQNLRRLLRARGLSQSRFADQLGVTDATVSRWLSRTGGMPMSTLQRICDALEVPLSAILVPDAPPEGDPVGLMRQALRSELDPLTHDRLIWMEWLEQATTWRDQQDQRLRRIEAAQTDLRKNHDRMRTALRQVPLYQQNHRGDPRLGEGDPNAALALAFAQLPPGATIRTVGQRGFALLVNNAVVAGLGVRRGDTVFVNPDAAYTADSLVAIGADWPEGPEGPAPPRGQPKAITLRVLAYGEGEHQGALVARTALEPPLEQGPELAPGAFTVYGPVVIHQGVTFLQEGRRRGPDGAEDGDEAPTDPAARAAARAAGATPSGRTAGGSTSCTRSRRRCSSRREPFPRRNYVALQNP
jgi:transcriptional regulator with XRE-family HTH domain